MPEQTSLLAFGLVALGMALTPGPNMIYLVSRSICQGRAAGLMPPGGVALGFIVYMLLAAPGITALLLAVPFAYDALRFVSVNALIAMTAGSISGFLARRPTWLAIQRWIMGTALAGLAVRMALEARR
jgi:threonine/homoserine/homoserine lactone efflux protein